MTYANTLIDSKLMVFAACYTILKAVLELFLKINLLIMWFLSAYEKDKDRMNDKTYFISTIDIILT